jgi:ATP-dependent DNA ligase
VCRDRGRVHAAFDLLWLNGKDLRAQPLTKRKQRLEQLIPAKNATLSRVPSVEEHGRERYEAAQCLDLEGIVPSGRQTLLTPDGLVQSRIRPIP